MEALPIPTEDGLPPLPSPVTLGIVAGPLSGRRKAINGYTADHMRDYARAALASRAAAMAPEGEDRVSVSRVAFKLAVSVLSLLGKDAVAKELEASAAPSSEVHGAEAPAGEPKPTPDWDAWNMCSRLNAALQQIGDYAHDHSTGPAVPDALWEVRRMAYEAMEEPSAPPAGHASITAPGDGTAASLVPNPNYRPSEEGTHACTCRQYPHAPWCGPWMPASPSPEEVRVWMEAMEHIERRLQMDIDDGSRPDQWSMEALVRKAQSALSSIRKYVKKEGGSNG